MLLSKFEHIIWSHIIKLDIQKLLESRKSGVIHIGRKFSLFVDA